MKIQQMAEEIIQASMYDSPQTKYKNKLDGYVKRFKNLDLEIAEDGKDSSTTDFDANDFVVSKGNVKVKFKGKDLFDVGNALYLVKKYDLKRLF